MNSATALDVANAIRSRCNDGTGDPMTPLKLQKLLYYVQAWSLVFDGRPAFDDDIEAWAHGPLVPTVWKHFREHDGHPLPKPSDEETPDLDDDLFETIDMVVGAYGSLRVEVLERMTHAEQPWLQARGNLPPEAQSHNVLSLDTIQRFYSSLLEKHARKASQEVGPPSF